MRKLLPWYGAGLILVVIFGTIYAVVQQAQRADANYPQIQIAENAAAALNQGAKPAALASGRVNLAASLAPFTIVYDKTGRVVAGSGYLDGIVPQVPYGVLAAANNKPYNFVTWQPRQGVRIAAVSVAASRYYVLSGRLLTEVEKNESQSLRLSLLGGLIALMVLAGTWLAAGQPAKKH